MEWVSVISACIAAVAAWIAYWSLRSQRHLATIATAFPIMNEAEKMLGSAPDLLKLHGVTDEMLEECGASPGEIVYTLLSFNSDAAFYHIQETKKVELTLYRRRMLNTPEVRRIWSCVLRKSMYNSTPFVDAVDDYIRAVEATEHQETAADE